MLRYKNYEDSINQVVTGKFAIGNVLKSPAGKLWIIDKRLSIEKIRIKYCDNTNRNSRSRNIDSLLDWELFQRNIKY